MTITGEGKGIYPYRAPAYHTEEPVQRNLLAGDIVKTVTLEATMNNVAVLGLFVLVHTFLSWAMNVEIDGRWSWRRAPETAN
ncbi:MAG TPA: DUF1622 domain-containing protein [Steroidobacteraceae bacterium]|jgi:hypothetical protein|nr:DUF1622 domain-containing protein [Steroidobacteraceae bacterium]